jgi:hypothetical protein
MRSCGAQLLAHRGTATDRKVAAAQGLTLAHHILARIMRGRAPARTAPPCSDAPNEARLPRTLRHAAAAPQTPTAQPQQTANYQLR